jgi:hypothetical protein
MIIISRICLFVCFIYSCLSNFSLSGDCHHYQWRGCKFRPLLSTYGFQQWGFFYVPHLLRHGTPIYKVPSERLVIFSSNCRAPGEGLTITTYFNVLGLTWPARAGLELTTFWSQGGSSTTEPLRPVKNLKWYLNKIMTISWKIDRNNASNQRVI